MAHVTTDADPVRRAVALTPGPAERRRGHDDGTRPGPSRSFRRGATPPVSGSPVPESLLEDLADIGITEVCVVLGPEGRGLRGSRWRAAGGRIEVTAVVRQQDRGSADALIAAAPFAGHDRVMVLDSRVDYPRDALAALAAEQGSALLGVSRETLDAAPPARAEVPRPTAVIAVGEDDTLRNVIEQPDLEIGGRLGADAPVSLDAWLFTASIFEACTRIAPSVCGEFEILDAVRLLISEGVEFTVVPAPAPAVGACEDEVFAEDESLDETESTESSLEESR